MPTTLTLTRPAEADDFAKAQVPAAPLTNAEQMAVLGDAAVNEADRDAAMLEAKARMILSAMDAAGQGRKAAALARPTARLKMPSARTTSASRSQLLVRGAAVSATKAINAITIRISIKVMPCCGVRFTDNPPRADRCCR